MCLRSHRVHDDDGGVNGGRRAHGISDDNGGVGRGRVIDEASEGLETMTEVAGDQQRAQGIYDDDNGGVGGGR